MPVKRKRCPCFSVELVELRVLFFFEYEKAVTAGKKGEILE